jgi:hypothetical protein
LTTSVVPDQPSLQLDLPDPESDDISTMEFLARLEQAWAICDRFDLQTEIWRGRILGAVRDREKRGGEGRGAGFLQWLRENEISKTRAYGLIQLAEAADAMLTEGALEESSVNQFSKRAFMETAQAVPEVQLMISEAANEGQEITRKQVRRLTDEFTAATSPLLPEEIRQRTQENLLPPRAVAPLVRELAKLPEPQQEDFRKVLRDEPELDRIKDVTSTARWITKANESGAAVRAFQQGELDLDKAMQEAQRLDALGLLADAVGQAQALESAGSQAAHVLETAWRFARAPLGGKWQQYALSPRCAQCLAVSKWGHDARVVGGVGRWKACPAAIGGGITRPTGSAALGLTPDLVLVILGPLDLVCPGFPRKRFADSLRVGSLSSWSACRR